MFFQLVRYLAEGASKDSAVHCATGVTLPLRYFDPLGFAKQGDREGVYNLHMGRMVIVSAGLKTALNGGKLGNPAYLIHSCTMKSRVSLALKPA